MTFDPMMAIELLTTIKTGRPAQRVSIGPEVQDSDDLKRVIALPRRKLAIGNPWAAKYWTERLRKPVDSCDCKARWGYCITDLNPVQGWALEEASQIGGLLASIGVGGGKTGIDILLAMAIPGVRTAGLLVPANLRAQLLLRDYPQWSVHFQTPNLAGGNAFVLGRPVLQVISYPELSLPKNSDLLDRIDNLDLLIEDECHALSDPDSARTKRFLRAFQRRSGRRLKSASQSGTLTKRAISEVAHLSALALGDGSPFPISSPVVEEWGKALDAESFRNPVPAPPGALFKLVGPEESKIENDLERVRAGFQRRLSETPGVIVTYDPELPCAVEISQRKLTMPNDLRAIIEQVQSTLERPDGEELIEKIEVAAVCNQICSGFFYRWRYPHGESEQQIDRWFKARKAWRREVRMELNRAAKADYDSPALIMRAAIRWHHGYHAPDPKNPAERIWIPPQTRTGPLPVFPAYHWTEWEAVHKTVRPVKDAVWLDEFAVRDSIAWAREHRGIVWYDHVEFADRLELISRRERFDFPVFRGGEKANAGIIRETGNRPIAASIAAHGEGKNLQHAFCENLIAHPPGSGKTWEQVIGRTHRPGQKADVVSIWVYRYHEILSNAIESARNDAAYAQQLLGSKQRLNLASFDF